MGEPAARGRPTDSFKTESKNPKGKPGWGTTHVLTIMTSSGEEADDFLASGTTSIDKINPPAPWNKGVGLRAQGPTTHKENLRPKPLPGKTYERSMKNQ